MATETMAPLGVGRARGNGGGSLWGRLRLGQKMAIGLGVILLLLLVVGFSGWRYTRLLAAEFDGLNQNNLQAAVQLSNAETALWELRNGIPEFLVGGEAERRRILADEPRWYGEIERNLSAYARGTHTSDEVQAYREWDEVYRRYRETRQRWFELQLAGRTEEAEAWRSQTTSSYGVSAVASLGKLIELQRVDADRQVAEATNTAETATTLIEVLVVGTLLFGTAVGVFLTRAVTGPVGSVATAARRLADGDLAARAEVNSADEVGEMARAFNRMARRQIASLEGERTAKEYLQAKVDEYIAFVEQVSRGDLSGQIAVSTDDELGALGRNLNGMARSLQELAVQTKETAANLSSASSEITAAVSQQSSGAAEQSAAIAQTTATVDEVRASSEQAVQIAESVSESAEETSRIAQEGSSALRDATGAMDDIRQRVDSIAENILVLSEQTQQIGEIIATVNDLADQSNILALNAAIEASRAGEQGRGFAVVAQNIRGLAEQSKTATAQVRALLSDIQRATNAAVLATEQGTKGVTQGVDLINQAEGTIATLVDSSERATLSSRQIAAALRQHSVGMEQIAAAMSNINQATSQNLAATQNTQGAAEKLMELAGRLDRLAMQYHV